MKMTLIPTKPRVQIEMSHEEAEDLFHVTALDSTIPNLLRGSPSSPETVTQLLQDLREVLRPMWRPMWTKS